MHHELNCPTGDGGRGTLTHPPPQTRWATYVSLVYRSGHISSELRRLTGAIPHCIICRRNTRVNDFTSLRLHGVSPSVATTALDLNTQLGPELACQIGTDAAHPPSEDVLAGAFTEEGVRENNMSSMARDTLIPHRIYVLSVRGCVVFVYMCFFGSPHILIYTYIYIFIYMYTLIYFFWTFAAMCSP